MVGTSNKLAPEMAIDEVASSEWSEDVWMTAAESLELDIGLVFPLQKKEQATPVAVRHVEWIVVGWVAGFLADHHVFSRNSSIRSWWLPASRNAKISGIDHRWPAVRSTVYKHPQLQPCDSYTWGPGLNKFHFSDIFTYFAGVILPWP